jgi:hypothetical protein
MELQSDRFKESLMALLASPQVAVFGSLPACRYGHDLPFVEAIKRRPDTAILTLTKSNRDAAALQVEDLLKNIVGSSASAASILELQAGSTASSERKLSNCGSIPADNFFSSDPAEHTDVREEEPAEKRRKLSSELLL